jgi:NADPH:quinone reductase-like Zn-dependent oxidoreductase
MQAAGIDAFGGDVHVLELPAPAPPAPDEVVISVRAAGVGNWDEIVRIGNWEVGRRPPLALGVEAAGVVVAVGNDVSSLAPGDAVLTHPVPLRGQGAWAELLVGPAALVARKPAAVPWERAAAFPVPALTADQALGEAAPSPPGEWVLVHGAGGGTGGIVVQLAAARGANVVATAGPSSAARVRDYGACVVLDYHDPEWPARARDATPNGRGVAAAVNAARGGAATALRAVASDGRLATITGDPPPAQRGITIADVYVRADGARLAALADDLANGLLSLQVGATLPLAEAAAALQGAVAGSSAGATVLTLEEMPSEAAGPRRRKQTAATTAISSWPALPPEGPPSANAEGALRCCSGFLCVSRERAPALPRRRRCGCRA